MKIIMEEQDYIEAVTPFRNGCGYRAIFKANGDVFIDYGCYHLMRLQVGADREIAQMLIRNDDKPIKIDIKPETKIAILKIPPCERCGDTLFEPRN